MTGGTGFVSKTGSNESPIRTLCEGAIGAALVVVAGAGVFAPDSLPVVRCKSGLPLLGVLPRALLGVKVGETADSEAPLDSPVWANAVDAVKHPKQKAAKSTFFMTIDGGFRYFPQ